MSFNHYNTRLKWYLNNGEQIEIFEHLKKKALLCFNNILENRLFDKCTLKGSAIEVRTIHVDTYLLMGR